MSYVLVLGLISCGGDKNEKTDDVQANIVKEETATFSGDALSENERMLRTEFTSAGYFEMADSNNDNMLDTKEHTSALFNSWDTNKNNTLDKNEWSTASKDFGLANDSNWNWSAWDTNNDNTITKAEFSTQLANSDMFANWDKNKDNMLDKDEYTAGLFGLWNAADNDGTLDEGEYRNNVKKYFDSSEKKYMPERG